MITRCGWVPEDDPLYLAYHDEEWGVPVRDERGLFELLTLEGAQAGLSWSTILRKREGYRRAFAGFDPAAVARFGDATSSGCSATRGSSATAARSSRRSATPARSLDLDGSLSELLWSFVDGEPRTNTWAAVAEIPAQTAESAAMSKELKRLGFRFVGPTTCYSLMQAAGLVDDHVTSCFRHRAA